MYKPPRTQLSQTVHLVFLEHLVLYVISTEFTANIMAQAQTTNTAESSLLDCTENNVSYFLLVWKQPMFIQLVDAVVGGS